ncbi:MAG: hypothetical protein ABIJ09_00170 [Pseudomonadota bacterium]
MKTFLVALALVTCVCLARPALAAEYKCKGDSVDKSGSTQFKIRRSGTDFTVEKSGSTKGKCKKSGSKYVIEVSGSTKATIENGKIYKSGSSWGTVSEAQRTFECPDNEAATLWVLQKIGAI